MNATIAEKQNSLANLVGFIDNIVSDVLKIIFQVSGIIVKIIVQVICSGISVISAACQCK